MKLNDFLKIEEIRTYCNVAATEQQYIKTAASLFPKKAQQPEDGEEEAEAGAAVGMVQDLMAERHIY